MNKVLAIFTSLAAVLLLAAATSAAFAQQDYKTPQDAVDALVAIGQERRSKSGARGARPGRRGHHFVRRQGVRRRRAHALRRVLRRQASDRDGRRQQGGSGHRRQRLSVPDPAARATRTAPGRSIPMTGRHRNPVRAASVTTNSMRSRPAWLMSTRKTITRRRIAGAGAGRLRAALHQHGGQEGRPVLADRARRRGKPARRAVRRGIGAGLPRRRGPLALSRLLLQDPDQTGPGRDRRRRRLCRRTAR